jgi:hypothetical protein
MTSFDADTRFNANGSKPLSNESINVGYPFISRLAAGHLQWGPPHAYYSTS